jgi:hypothetical protein
MTDQWRPFFDVYKAERPGVKHNGWNPERVFEAAFHAGMLNGSEDEGEATDE